MKNKRSKEIFEYWDNNAKTYGVSHVASWGDANMMALEVDAISRFIKKGDAILDAGCANGYSTLQFLKKGPASIRGFDYSPRMVSAAQKNLENLKGEDLKERVFFYHADILDIPEKDASFDISITTRVLINLPSWNLQKRAIDEMCRVTKPGGHIIFSEAFTGSQKKLNSLRKIFGLPALKPPVFNNYLEESRLEDYLRRKKLSFEVVKFSSIYYLGSRLIREMYLEKNDKPSFSHPINDFFMNLEMEKDRLDFGIQKLYGIKKP